MTRGQALHEVRKYGGGVEGRAVLERYLSGTRITRQEAIAAKCYECFGYCADGRPTCPEESCALWPFSPFTTCQEAPQNDPPEAKSGVNVESLPPDEVGQDGTP